VESLRGDGKIELLRRVGRPDSYRVRERVFLVIEEGWFAGLEELSCFAAMRGVLLRCEQIWE
jgi:hypothetical protein